MHLEKMENCVIREEQVCRLFPSLNNDKFCYASWKIKAQ